MAQAKVRIPKQQRSIEKKSQIKKAAYDLICEKGYHTITTNLIAKEACLSIGSLYEYYANKEDILKDILTEYFEGLLHYEDAITTMLVDGLQSSEQWHFIHSLLSQQIEHHKESAAFNRELHVLYYSVPIVASICTEQKMMLRRSIISAFTKVQSVLTVTDLDAAAWVFMDILDSAIDRVVFNPPTFDAERYITAATDAICQYLFHS